MSEIQIFVSNNQYIVSKGSSMLQVRNIFRKTNTH